ncbi:MAG TPA: zf-HC2 domain-containing protein [Asanoa sp.]
MDSTDPCAEIRPLLAELALGAASGHDRARLLGHVATCAACSLELERVATVADGLLLLAPLAEPPAGFEAAVLARMAAPAQGAGGDRKRPDRRRRRSLAVAAGVVAAALAGGVSGAAVTYDQGTGERVLAEQYRRVLATADGHYLRALRLATDSGAAAGTVFLYEGHPSWLLVAVADAPENGAYDMAVTYAGGLTRRAGTCQIVAGTGTTAYQLHTRVADVAGVTLTGPNGTRIRTSRG